MSDAARIDESQGLRRTLRITALALFVLTPLELFFQEHSEGVQLLAFVACGLGIAGATSVGEAAPGSVRRRVGIALLGVVAAIALLGLWEHFEHNYAFAREIRPEQGAAASIRDALFGASPPLAPGILILAAWLPWAARRR